MSGRVRRVSLHTPGGSLMINLRALGHNLKKRWLLFFSASTSFVSAEMSCRQNNQDARLSKRMALRSVDRKCKKNNRNTSQLRNDASITISDVTDES